MLSKLVCDLFLQIEGPIAINLDLWWGEKWKLSKYSRNYSLSDFFGMPKKFAIELWWATMTIRRPLDPILFLYWEIKKGCDRLMILRSHQETLFAILQGVYQLKLKFGTRADDRKITIWSQMDNQEMRKYEKKLDSVFDNTQQVHNYNSVKIQCVVVRITFQKISTNSPKNQSNLTGLPCRKILASPKIMQYLFINR